jgi:hypothetical protein
MTGIRIPINLAPWIRIEVKSLKLMQIGNIVFGPQKIMESLNVYNYYRTTHGIFKSGVGRLVPDPNS